jgi:hypothetical protein
MTLRKQMTALLENKNLNLKRIEMLRGKIRAVENQNNQENQQQNYPPWLNKSKFLGWAWSKAE